MPKTKKKRTTMKRSRGIDPVADFLDAGSPRAESSQTATTKAIARNGRS